jgi:hypothetical protein
MRYIFLVLCFSLLSVLTVGGQTSVGVTPDMRTEANIAFQKQDWESATKAYEKIVSMEDKNANARYRYGVSLLGLKRNEEAVKALETALTLAPNPVFSLALARAYARLGNSAKMFEVLDGSLKLGGIQPASVTAEADFAAYKADPKFLAFLEKTDKAVNPCKAKPEFRQFDFWIGEWLPKNVQGVTVGTSSIQLILGSCIIFENWSTPVSSGKSFNVYDVRDGKWHQTWVDDKGLITHYVGGLVDGKMILDSETIANGKKVINRMTYSKFPNGDVRQHGETSADAGKTWTTTFDFTYVRKT